MSTSATGKSEPHSCTQDPTAFCQPCFDAKKVPFDPIKLCCFRPRSEHAGPQCPDGLVMCCLCFGRVGIDMLAVEDDGMKVDVCKPCRAAEDAELERRDRRRT